MMPPPVGSVTCRVTRVFAPAPRHHTTRPSLRPGDEELLQVRGRSQRLGLGSGLLAPELQHVPHLFLRLEQRHSQRLAAPVAPRGPQHALLPHVRRPVVAVDRGSLAAAVTAEEREGVGAGVMHHQHVPLPQLPATLQTHSADCKPPTVTCTPI
eukprot:3008332-Rhodomonas_salina.3